MVENLVNGFLGSMFLLNFEGGVFVILFLFACFSNFEGGVCVIFEGVGG